MSWSFVVSSLNLVRDWTPGREFLILCDDNVHRERKRGKKRGNRKSQILLIYVFHTYGLVFIPSNTFLLAAPFYHWSMVEVLKFLMDLIKKKVSDPETIGVRLWRRKSSCNQWTKRWVIGFSLKSLRLFSWLWFSEPWTLVTRLFLGSWFVSKVVLTLLQLSRVIVLDHKLWVLCTSLFVPLLPF